MNDLIRLNEAAELLRIKRSTFFRWMKELPDFPAAIRPTTRVTLFNRAELLAYFEKLKGKQHGKQ